MNTNNRTSWVKVMLYIYLGTACTMLVKTAAAQEKPLQDNVAPTTPTQQAQYDRMSYLDHSAAVAMYIGNYAAAEVDVRESMALGQDSGVAAEELAEALDAQGKEQEALQEYQTLAEQGTSFPRNLLPYALLLLKTGQWEQALAAYQKALSLVPEQTSPVEPHLDQTFSPDDPQPTELAAAIHVALGLTDNWECDWAGNSQGDKALEQYQQALTLEPDWDIANYYYGYGLQKLGRSAQAQAAFTKTIKIAHGSVKVAARKALAKIKPAA